MNENKKYLWLILFVAAVLAVAWFSFGPSAPEVQAPQAPEVQASPKNYQVEIKGNAFEPAVVKIKKGDSVTWINRDAVSHWPASAVHPTHTVYPESGGCIGSKFDACRGLKQGETYTFVFNQTGMWKYHDHLNAAGVKPGTVEVSE